jgi:hypothetical protein
MTDTTFTPTALTVAAFREAHPFAVDRTDEQVQWYCDLDALVVRAFKLDIPAEAVISALDQIASDRLAETDDAETE